MINDSTLDVELCQHEEKSSKFQERPEATQQVGDDKYCKERGSSPVVVGWMLINGRERVNGPGSRASHSR